MHAVVTSIWDENEMLYMENYPFDDEVDFMPLQEFIDLYNQASGIEHTRENFGKEIYEKFYLAFYKPYIAPDWIMRFVYLGTVLILESKEGRV